MEVPRIVLKFITSKREAKLQWLEDPGEINWNNLNNVRHEASRYFRNKKKGISGKHITELAMNSKIQEH
jgi:hypothetical protein